MPAPARNKAWEIAGAYLAVVLLGIPALLILAMVHLSVVDFACNCMPLGFPDWDSGARAAGAIFTGIPLGLADWFVWTRWRSRRRESKWAAAYREKHLPELARRRDQR